MLTNLSIIRPPKVNEKWNFKDHLGALKVRMSFGRGNYKVNSGLYSYNEPKPDSEVFVSANYKLSFDILRKELKGLNAWILVLDTKGINVWCAAGKGTFGTAELINQIKNTNLDSFVKHRRLIVPQLGAPGVDASKVKLDTGYTVKFGPVRASDIKPYLQAGLKKTEKMSKVEFNAIDRAKLLPVEFVNTLKKFLLVAIAFFVISGLSLNQGSLHIDVRNGLKVVVILLIAYISGTIITPFFLPWIPFRSFSAKGMFAGAIVVGTALLIVALNNVIANVSIFLVGTAISSYLAMNFTGASTYTSLSGVRKEMKIFVPIQALSASIGIIVFTISRFVN
jgi:hypothetical protein